MRRGIALAVGVMWCATGTAWGAGKKPPPLCETAATTPTAPPYVAVFSSFPAELAPIIAATEIETTVEADGAQYYLGRLGGVNVILGLLGIGMVNARTSTERVLANFDVAGIVVSGVAGSHHRIGDVVVAATWVEQDRRRVLHANRALLALAERGAASLPEPFQACTTVQPSSPCAPQVCLPFEPAVVFEDRGVSGDPFGGEALACIPGGGDIFGCELPAAALATAAEPASADAEDMETAAVARVAARQRVPFVGVRAVSDGAGDPCGDRGFPLQFFDYYHLAAFNAAVITRAVVTELGALASSDVEQRVCRLLGHRRWRRAANLIRSAP